MATGSGGISGKAKKGPGAGKAAGRKVASASPTGSGGIAPAEGGPLGGVFTPAGSGPGSRGKREAACDRPSGYRELTERILLGYYSPTSALIDESGEILHLTGAAERFLKPEKSGAGLNIIDRSREGLRPGLVAAIHGAITARVPVRRDGLKVRTGSGFSRVNLVVLPVSGESESGVEGDWLVILFEEAVP